MNEKRNEFRVFFLKPSQDGGASDSFLGVIGHASLDYPPWYNTLSYAWESTERTAKILVDDAEILVTQNLYSALQHMSRGIRDEIPLWVDAICINQIDKKEKSSQVRRMRDIYKTAQTGIAWVGPATPKSIATLLNLCDVSKLNSPELEPTPGSEGMWRVWVDDVLDILRRRHLALGDFNGVDALQEFFTRSFCTRMWIVQEIVVGREVLVLCGDVYIHWQELNIGYHRLYVCAIFILGTRDLAKTPTEVALVNMWLRYARGSNVLDAQTPFVRKESPTLRQLLHFISARGTDSSLKAYDPRDMIYAILGEISDREELGLNIDYKKPFQDVYTDVARYLLSQGHPDTLYHSQSATMRAGLPSWVTNWAAPLLPRINESTSGNRPPRYCCAGQGDLSVNFPENSSGRAILEVSGVEVDLISEIGEEIPIVLDLQSVSNFLVQFRVLLEKALKHRKTWKMLCGASPLPINRQMETSTRCSDDLQITCAHHMTQSVRQSKMRNCCEL